MEQALTRLEALRSYTTWAAFSQFEERCKGRLRAGLLADFVILDRDVLSCPEADLPFTQAVATVVGGELVHGTLASRGPAELSSAFTL